MNVVTRETRKAQLTTQRVQRQCMSESPVKQNLSVHHNNHVFSRQRAPDDWQLIIYSVSLVLTRGRDLSRSANAVSTGNCKFSLPLCHLSPSFGVTPFEFMQKLYGSWN